MKLTPFTTISALISLSLALPTGDTPSNGTPSNGTPSNDADITPPALPPIHVPIPILTNTTTPNPECDEVIPCLIWFRSTCYARCLECRHKHGDV